MQAMESGEVSITAPDLREIDEQDSDPPSEDESPLGDPFSVEDMGAEFVFIQPADMRAPTPPTGGEHLPPPADDTSAPQDRGTGTRKLVEPVREIFQGAGKIISQNQSQHEAWKKKSMKGSSPYEPFASQIDYAVAKWAKELGPGDTALSKLLEIPGVS